MTNNEPTNQYKPTTTRQSVERERLEFKECWNPEIILRSIYAFVNDFHNLDGGYIVVGIKEKDGQPVLFPKVVVFKILHQHRVISKIVS